MKVKDLKKMLEKSDDELEISMLVFSHEHLYNCCDKEIGCIEFEEYVPLKSITIKNDDGYGVVILSNKGDK